MRSSDRALTRWLMLLAAVAICVSIGLPLVGVRVFHAADVLQLFAPWRDEAPTAVRPVNGQVTDTVDVVAPMRAEYRRRALDGDFPSWTSYPSGGQPLGGVPDLGTLSPLNLPYLIFPPWYAPGAAKLLEMIVAVGFTFLFLRCCGLRRHASVLGGVIFAFSGFQVVWTNWPQTHVGALIPAVFWAVDRCVALREWGGVAPVAAVVGVMFLEGFPAVAGYAIAGAGAWAVVRMVHARRSAPENGAAPVNGAPGPRPARLAVAAAAVALGVGLAAVQLLPFLDRIREIELPARETLRGQHLPLRGIATLAIPDAFGSPVDRVYYGEPNYVELQAFIGCAALALIALTLFVPRSGREWRWLRPTLAAGATGCAFLIYVGGPPLRVLEALPFLGANPVGRLRSVFGFMLAGLAATGFDAIDSAGARRWSAAGKAVRGVVSVAAGGAIAYGLFRGWQIAGSFGYRRYAIRQAALPAVAGLAAVALIVAAVRRGRGSEAGTAARAAAWLIPVVVVVEALAFAIPFWPRIPRSQFYPDTRVHAFLAGHLGSDRFAAENRTMYTGTATYYGLRTVNAHAFQQPTWADALRAIDPTVFRAARRVPFLAAEAAVATSPLLDRLAARYFVAASEVGVFGDRAPPDPSDEVARLVPGRVFEAAPPIDRFRALIVRIAAVEIPPGVVARLRATIVGTDGGRIGEGSRRVFRDATPGEFEIAVTNDGDREVSGVRVSLEAARGSVSLEGSSPGTPNVGAVLDRDDGLRVAFADGAVVYRRTRMLGRIRWASRSTIVPDPRDRLRVLGSGVDPDVVVLDAGRPLEGGGDATVRILEDSGDAVRVLVDASGPGYLVVADAIQDGWVAEIDGRPASLLDADHALVAVAVPGGDHTVTLRYAPDGRRVGAILSLSALIAVLAIGAASVAAARRRRAV